MKRTSLLIITSILLSAINSLASSEESFARGFIIAADSRDHRACDIAQQKVLALTGTNVLSFCTGGGENPFSVAIITVPANEFEFVSEAESAHADKLTIASPGVAVIVGIPRSRETDNYFRVSSRRDKANLTVFRQRDFGAMEERRETTFTLAFVLKSHTEEGKRKDHRIANSVSRKLIYNRGEISITESQYKSIVKKAANIMETINAAIGSVTDNRTSVGFFKPPPSCDPNRNCPKPAGLSIGLSVSIRF
ncbi:hypothetical protein QJS83_02570 [Bdellovibrio sp. 22V]|uniref:hypothetical protein n=1 Tax=Bdellovibrio sp. 22V TaxID=3044166 RepID=UPI002543C0EE|nr:hypothetical protein [Bdellovibrio sp. 22V]WII72753.1 hypothetical protein QJS83_02570 [Bdellovibrio sp. 22V]